jgi:branched-chain amino acid transport system permease protein
MQDFIQLVLTGLTVGVIYAGIAVAYSTIYSATGIINFALGAQAMLAGYMAYVWFPGVPFVVRAFAAVCFGALFSAAAWHLVYRFIYARHGALPTVIASFSMSIAIQEIVRIFATADVRRADSPFGETVWRFDMVSVTAHMVGVLIVGAVLFVVIAAAFQSRWALMAKAVFQDAMMARAMGIRTQRVVMAIFLISGACAAIAGVLLAPLVSVSPFSGLTVALIGFVGAALGGLENVEAAAAGGLVLGVIQALFAGYASSDFTNAFVFGLLVIVLVIRPSGLLSRRRLVRV